MAQETAVLSLTDLHYGKETASFNRTVFRKRMQQLAHRVCKMRSHLKAYRFDTLVVCLLGDVNDGADIYPTQPHHQDETDAETQADECSSILAEFLQTLRKEWQSVRVEAVAGNHGRSGRAVHEGTNWDIVTYRYLREKVRSAIPVGFDKSFIRTVNIRNHQIVLYHGHGIKMYQGIPFYGIQQRMMRWRATDRFRHMRVLLTGHFHYFGLMSVNNVLSLASGTMVTDDTWALESLGYESSNQTWMFGVSSTRPVTWHYGVDLC